MALIFSSGGGRLGNQILNLIHLIALSEEYNIKILKVNDSFLTSKDKAFMYSIDVKKVNWEINNYSIGDSFIYKILQKIFIRFLHIYFFISLKAKSYKIGSENNYPKFILGKQLKNGFSIKKLIKEAEISPKFASEVDLGDDDDWHRLSVLLQTAQPDELLDPDLSPQNLAFRLFHEDGVRVFDRRSLHFACPCSGDRVRNMLTGLPEEDQQEMQREEIVIL